MGMRLGVFRPELLVNSVQTRIFGTRRQQLEVAEDKLHNKGTAPWLRRLVAGLSLRRLGFNPNPVHVGFVVYKIELRYDFLRIPRISPVNIIPPRLHALLLIHYRLYMLLAIDITSN